MGGVYKYNVGERVSIPRLDEEGVVIRRDGFKLVISLDQTPGREGKDLYLSLGDDLEKLDKDVPVW